MSIRFWYNRRMKIDLKVKNEKQMTTLGELIGKTLRGGEILALIGSLGAGKTTLTKAILSGAGVRQGFSPTFILMASHRPKRHQTLKYIHHLDLYRLNQAQELVTMGWYDIVGQPDQTVIVEWADRFPEAVQTLPKNEKMIIMIKKVLGNERSLKIEALGKKHVKILDTLIDNFGKLKLRQ